MIRYALRCAEGHDFDSWFRSAADFDRLSSAEQVGCAVCGSSSVEKAPMAPSVPAATAVADRPLSQPRDGIEAQLAALREHVERNSDYVGTRFAAVARDMHEGRAPERAIYGEARLDEARKLLEDGIPVAPLPFRPRSKVS